MKHPLSLKLVKFIKITGPISGFVAALSPLVLLIASDISYKNGAGDVSVKFGQPLNQLNYSFSQVDTSIKGCPNLRSQFNGFYEKTRNTQQINLLGFKPAPFLEGVIAHGNYQHSKNLALRYQNYPIIKFFIKDSSNTN